MILAETIVDNDKIVIAVASLLVVKGFDYFQAWLKDRREQRTDRQQTDALLDIANNIRDVRNGQIEQNGKLSTVVAVNKAYHEEVIRTLERNKLKDNK